MVPDIHLNKFEKWSEFVKNHPNGNIFQTPLMYEVYNKSKNNEPILIISEDDQGEINGVLLAVILKEGSSINGYFTSRSIIIEGPLIKDNSQPVLEYLLREYLRIIKNRVIYTQFRNNIYWGELKKCFNNNGFLYEDHLDIIHTLDSDEDELWKKLDYSKRKNINSAIKKGLEIKQVDLETELITVYDILKAVYKKAKLPLCSYEYLRISYNVFKNHLVGIGAYSNGKLIGFRLVLCYKQLVYDWYAGSLEEYLQYRPNDILPWEVMKWAKANGYKYFDFGGAGKPNVPYGVRDFKMKFGGDLINFGRFEKVHKPLLMIIGKVGLNLYKNIYGIYFRIKR